MPKIQLDFDRQESYALLVGQEFLRQVFGEKGDGIPLIFQIRSVTNNREYSQLDLLFNHGVWSWIAEVHVAAGDLWPKGGNLLLVQDDVGGNSVRYFFELIGNPDHPNVKFRKMTD